MNHTVTGRTAFRLLAMAGAIHAIAAPARVHAADVPKDWRVFETDQRTQEYRNKLREGTFDATSRGFLTDVALPQLALPANRDSIDKVRRRIKESLVAPPSLPTVVEFMTSLARDEAAPMAVRVNAMLLLGEVTGPDKRPWPATVQPLASALGDATVPPAIRVAAASGLEQHVTVTGKDIAASVGPVLVTVAKSDPAAGDAVAVNWLAGRAFAMLAMLGRDAPADAIPVASSVMADESRPLDVRVRAAAALGGAAAEGRGVDAAAALQGIRDLAVTIVREERDRARRQTTQGAPGILGSGGYTDSAALPPPMMAPSGGFPESSSALGGAGYAPPGMPFGSFPGSPPMGPTGMPVPSPATEGLQLALRRAAWRLWMLSGALDKDGATSGIVVVAGPLQDNARQMAAVLREASTAIESAPTVAAVESVFKKLGGEPAGKPAGDQSAAAGAAGVSAPPAPAPPAQAPPAGPQPAAANPFVQ